MHVGKYIVEIDRAIQILLVKRVHIDRKIGSDGCHIRLQYSVHRTPAAALIDNPQLLAF